MRIFAVHSRRRDAFVYVSRWTLSKIVDKCQQIPETYRRKGRMRIARTVKSVSSPKNCNTSRTPHVADFVDPEILARAPLRFDPSAEFSRDISALFSEPENLPQNCIISTIINPQTRIVSHSRISIANKQIKKKNRNFASASPSRYFECTSAISGRFSRRSQPRENPAMAGA